MEEVARKTKYRIKKEAEDLAIYNDYNEFMSSPDAMATAADAYIMEKYDIASKSTVWFVRKRVEKRLKEAGKL